MPLLGERGRLSAPDEPGSPQRCEQPVDGSEMRSAAPDQVDLDAAALRSAVQYATQRGAQSVRIYRHDCLVARSGNDPVTEHQRLTGWSMTKGVVSTVVGRAVTLGLLDVDDPIGNHLDGLDDGKAAITVRNLLNQTSGLRFAWLNDLWAAGNADSTADVLARPFEATPGSTFLYAQTTVTLLASVVEAAVGEDFQAFASRELFEPLGIRDGDWLWERDVAGHTQGFAFLQMTPIAWSRLGLLLVGDGLWAGQRLIDASYIEQGRTGSPANAGYGFLWRTNVGDWFITSDPSHERKQSVPWPGLPRDAFAYSGLFEQDVVVIPSLDMVVVRLGLPPELFGDPLGESPGLRPAYDWRFNRLLMHSVTDVDVPDPGPWVYPGPAAPAGPEHIVEPSLPPFNIDLP